MESSVCKIFRMHPLELREKLMLIDKSASDDDYYIAQVDQFIAERVTDYPDEILSFHLACRLHGTDDEMEGRNLADLLLSENQFSMFMKKYGIEFFKGEQHIEVSY